MRPDSTLYNVIAALSAHNSLCLKGLNENYVAFWVTNPCRITRKVKQTKMYVCTLEEFILVDIWMHYCASWN